MLKSSLKSKLISIALILVVLAVAVVGNMITIESVNKFSLKIDLTDNKLYNLSEVTTSVAESIEQPVVITVFASVVDYPVMVKEILAKYAGLSENIIVEYKDPYENPMLVDSLRQKGFSVAENDIVLNGKSRIKQLKVDDLYVFNAGKTEVTGLKAEQALTSALLYTDNDVNMQVEFTDGHGERPSGALMKIFEENNFDLKRIVLGVMEIADNTDIVVVAAPERDFQLEEIAKLESYLEQGGKLLVFTEPAETALPNFEALLQKWGIDYAEEVVFEEKAYLANNPLNIVPAYAPHPVNMFFADKRYFLISPATRALRKSGWSEYELDLMPVLTSSPASYGKTGNSSAAIRESEDTSGPFILALSSTRELLVDGEEEVARVLTIGSRNFYSDDILSKSSYANRDFLVQVINWLVAKDSSISIPVKNVAPDPINVLPDTIWTIGIIFIGVIPVLILLVGVYVCLRRKRL